MRSSAVGRLAPQLREARPPCAWVGAAVNAGKPARRASGASGRRCWRCRAVTKVTLSPCSLAPPVLPFRLDLSLDQALHLGVLELAAQPDFPAYARDGCPPGCPRTSDRGAGWGDRARPDRRSPASLRQPRLSAGFGVSHGPAMPAAAAPRGAPAPPAGKRAGERRSLPWLDRRECRARGMRRCRCRARLRWRRRVLLLNLTSARAKPLRGPRRREPDAAPGTL